MGCQDLIFFLQVRGGGCAFNGGFYRHHTTVIRRLRLQSLYYQQKLKTAYKVNKMSSSSGPTSTNRISTSSGRYLRDCLTILQEAIPHGGVSISSSADSSGTTSHKKRPRPSRSDVETDETDSTNEYDEIDNDNDDDNDNDQRRQQQRDKAIETLETLVPFVFGGGTKYRRLNDDDWSGGIIQRKETDDTKVKQEDSSLRTTTTTKGATTGASATAAVLDQGVESKKTLDPTTTTTTITHFATDLERYQYQLKVLQADNDETQTKKTHILGRYANFIDAYQSGLQHISKLTDLSYAPDNIMDGNFCKEAQT